MTTTDTQRGADVEGLRATSEQVEDILQLITHDYDDATIGAVCRDWLDMQAVIAAAQRRRQAEDEMRHREVEFTTEGWVEWRYREGVADKELRAALDALTTPTRDETAVTG
jgi:hypothetical protein